MRIDSSFISMKSKTDRVDVQQHTDFAKFLNDSNLYDNSEKIKKMNMVKTTDEKFMGLIKQVQMQNRQNIRNVNTLEKTKEIAINEYDLHRMKIIEYTFGLILGKKIRFYVLENPNDSNNNIINILNERFSLGLDKIKKIGTLQSIDFKLEQENMEFNSEGVIRTQDGREFNFSVKLNLNREFVTRDEVNIDIMERALIDPVIINFDGNVPQLTDTKYDFDIDFDGDMEQIPFVNEGSGFLAIDLNNDGKINSGLELFGPKSGNGFAELSKYDSDNNNWIDENDPIFEKLRIWSRDEKGNESLLALGVKGIGAIYVGGVASEFSFKDMENNLQGQVKQSGIYINEDGTVGTMMEVDLAL